VQELMGHSDVKTTMIYTHVLGLGASGVRSPLDALGCPGDDSPSNPADKRAMTPTGMSQPIGLERVTIKSVTSPFARYPSQRVFGGSGRGAQYQVSSTSRTSRVKTSAIVSKQLRGMEFQACCKLQDNGECRHILAAFDDPQVRWTDFSCLSELRLR